MHPQRAESSANKITRLWLRRIDEEERTSLFAYQPGLLKRETSMCECSPLVALLPILTNQWMFISLLIIRPYSRETCFDNILSWAKASGLRTGPCGACHASLPLIDCFQEQYDELKLAVSCLIWLKHPISRAKTYKFLQYNNWFQPAAIVRRAVLAFDQLVPGKLTLPSNIVQDNNHPVPVFLTQTPRHHS